MGTYGPDSGSSRPVSIRYFNLYRIIVASAFAIFGGVFSYGDAAPDLYFVTVVVYWVLAVTFVVLQASDERVAQRMLGLQVLLDIVVLAVFMYASGGYRSGLPFLMMTSIAGAGLVGQGRMVLGAASCATLAVLADQLSRVLAGTRPTSEFSQIAFICIGFFAVAVVARLLARRALTNEVLALERGAELERAMRINARIIEDMPEGIVVVGEKGLIHLSNPAAQTLLGIRLEAGQPIDALLPALKNFMVSGDEEMPLKPPNSRSLNIRRVQTGDAAILLYIEDMDRLHARAQQLKLAALGRLTANIAHEIRNPLSAVSHAGELLLGEKRQATQERLIRIIHDNAARIERMIRDVLELGRRDRLTTERLELLGFCQTLLEEQILRDVRIGDMVRMEIPAGIHVLFDRVHLYQILWNLLGNAVRYCSGTHGCLRLVARVLDRQRVLLIIADDGPGVPLEDRAKVFEPFFTSDPKGTGLGLYTARELAEANHASLELMDSAAGAEFHLIARSTE